MLFFIISMFAGVGLIFLSWKGKVAQTPAKLGGWAAVLLSLVVAIMYFGPEFGPVYTFLFLACAAGLFVAIEAESWKAKPLPIRGEWPSSNSSTWLKQIAYFCFVFFVGGLASMNSAVLLGLICPGEFVDGMALAVILTPILWGGAMYWATAYWTSARIGIPFILIISTLLLIV